MAYVDQSRDSLAADKSVWEEIAGGQDNVGLEQIMIGVWSKSRGYAAAEIVNNRNLAVTANGRRHQRRLTWFWISLAAFWPSLVLRMAPCMLMIAIFVGGVCACASAAIPKTKTVETAKFFFKAETPKCENRTIMRRPAV